MSYIREYSELNPKEQRQLRYKRRYKENVPGWDDSMVLLTRLVADRLGSAVSIFDYGCGRGNFVVDELVSRFSRKVGYDVDADATRGNVSMQEVVLGDGRSLPFPDASFDLVTSLWVMEHVAEPKVVLAEIHRVLKPGGLFAFVTPNRRSALIRFRRIMNKRTADMLLDRLYGRKDEDVFDVFYRLNTVSDIRWIAERTGFQVEVLQENGDPSYTSFGEGTYQFSRAFSALPISLSKPHLVCVLRRT